MEKSDHTLNEGKLQSSLIAESKWSANFIDFVADLYMSSRSRDRILVEVDKATKRINLEPYSKGINCMDAAKRP